MGEGREGGIVEGGEKGFCQNQGKRCANVSQLLPFEHNDHNNK